MTQRRWQRLPDGSIGRREEEPEPEEKAYRPSPLRVLRLTIRDCWDHLGPVLLSSLVLPAAALSAVSFAFWAASGLFAGLPGILPWLGLVVTAHLAISIVLGPCLAGLHYFCWSAAARSEPEPANLAWGFIEQAGASIRLAWLQGLGLWILALNVAYYFTWRSLAGYSLGMISAYALVFWLLCCAIQWPLWIENQAHGSSLRRAALLVLDNLWFCLAFGILLAAFSILLWIFVLPGLLLAAGAGAMFATHAAREMLRKYRLLPPDPTLDPAAAETTQFRIAI